MRFMTLREFLRGGYQRLQGPTMIVRRGLPLFTVMPHGSAPVIDSQWLKESEQRNEQKDQ